MATHPSILSDMIRREMDPEDETTLDVERDLGTPGGEGPPEDSTDPARDLAIPPSDLAPADRDDGNG